MKKRKTLLLEMKLRFRVSAKEDLQCSFTPDGFMDGIFGCIVVVRKPTSSELVAAAAILAVELMQAYWCCCHDYWNCYYLKACCFYSRQHYRFCPTASDVSNRPFSSSAFTLFHLLAPCKFPSQSLEFKASATLYAKPFSSSSAPNGDDDYGVSSLTMVESESECDFDADVGKAIVGLFHSPDDEGCSTVGDSTMVELGNDTNEEGIVVDFMVASDNNDDVGLERCEGHLNVASRDPVEVYCEFRNAEKGAKLTRCDWEIMQPVFNYFGKSG
nr:hypothetical protein CFP56_18050 [Quercus suber]